MTEARHAPPITSFALATGAVSAAACLQTYLTRRAGGAELDLAIFERLFAYTDGWGAALQLLIVVLVALSPRVRAYGARLALAIAERPVATAAAAVVVFAFGAKLAYHAIPFAMDESAPLAQAHAFAQGHLSWVLPVDLLDRMIPPGFRHYFFAIDPATGRVASMYWPGFAALLAPFAWAQVPWLLNPLLGGATLLLLHAFGSRHFQSREAGGWAVLLALASPEFTVNALSLYSMPAHLLFNLGFAWLLLDGRTSRAFVAGLLGGWALVLHNPVPHALFAAPWLLWLALHRRRWPALLAVAIGYLPIGLGVGFAWPAYLAGIGPKGVSVAAPSATGLGQMVLDMASKAFRLPDHAVIGARLLASWKIWIWSMPGLLLLAVGGARIIRGPVLLLAASAALTYGVYWFVPFDQGHGWGYRYFHSAWGVLPLYGAAFVAGQPLGRDEGRAWRHWIGGIALLSTLFCTALRFGQVDAIIGRHLAQKISVPDGGKWVVFVRFQPGLYTWDMIQNMPGDVHQITLMSFGTVADERLMAGAFPGYRLAAADARGSLWQSVP
jgi:hypothetical protein